ncbi:hypothetical protein EDD15DRAFT_2430948 [Pisolithus albus]|nr:hypothetical protein EDD15DRAFT_2430948 [Pisolithus albus]
MYILVNDPVLPTPWSSWATGHGVIGRPLPCTAYPLSNDRCHPQSIVATLHMRNLLLQRCHRHKILRLAHWISMISTVHGAPNTSCIFPDSSHISVNRQSASEEMCLASIWLGWTTGSISRACFFFANCDTQTTLYSDCSGRSSNNVLPSSTNYVPSDPPSGRCPSQGQVLPAEFLSHWRDPLVDTTELSSGRNRLSEKSLNFEECASSASSFNWGF